MNGLRHIKGVLTAVLILLMILSVSGGTDYAFADNEFEIEITTAQPGNIFVENEFEFGITIKNYSNTVTDGKLKYTVLSDGKAVKSGEKAVSAVMGNTNVKVGGSVEKYGIYTIVVNLYTGSDDAAATAQSDFSSICKTEQNPNVGFAQHALALGIGSVENAVYFSKLFGCGIIRDDYPMCFVEKNDGTVRDTPDNSTKRITDFTDAVYADNIKPLAILGPGPDEFPTNTGENIIWPISESVAENTKALKYWYDYCYNLAKWTKGKCDTFEVYNEWSIQQRNKPERNATALSYAMVLKTSSEAIRAANPNAKIVAFCAEKDTNEWLEEVLSVLSEPDKNPGQYFDALSVHPYVYWKNDYPEQEPHSNSTDLAALRRVMQKYNVGDKEIYATEYGETSNRRNGTVLTEEQKAINTIRDLAINGRFAAKHYLYTLYSKTYATDAYERGFGFIKHYDSQYSDTPCAALPSAVALAAYNKIMNSAEYLSDSVLKTCFGANVYDYQYKTADGEVCVIWNVLKTESINIHVDAQRVTVYDMYGNESELTSKLGNYTIEIGNSPVYIRADSLKGLKIAGDSNTDYGLPYSNDIWRMILKDKTDRTGTSYKAGGGFGRTENSGKFFLFELWN